MALVTILWVVNVSFLIYGKSLFTRPADELKLSQTWILTRHHSGKELISNYFQFSGLNHPQIRPAWAPVPDSCLMAKVESNKASIISMFITDFILLVAMLVGLLRMGVLGPDTFALGSLLWKQVRRRRLLSGRVSPSTNVISIQQGLIWLLLATTVEILPVVRPAGVFTQLFSHH